jgi:hypothetical protein
VSPDDFRKLALALPEAVESEHQGHPDFRVGGKVFASLGPREAWGMVAVTPDRQAALMDDDPDAFEPFAGAWGKRGCTKVHLDAAPEAAVRDALRAAWRARAPKRLVDDAERP